MKCRKLLKYGHESVATPPFATGTLADRLRLMRNVPVLRVPDDADDVQMVSAGCAVATAAAVVATAGTPSAGTRVLVFGAGAVGAYCAAMFSSLGCVVRVREPSPERMALVARLGAEPDVDDEPFPVVVEASGNANAVVDALHSADIGAHVVAAGSVSLGSSTVTFDPALLVTRRLRLSGVHNYTAENFRWGVDWLLAHGRTLGLEQLVSPALPLSAVDEAFRQMKDGTYARVLVRPDGVAATR
jgi:threonine 3-dehydrogenase